MQATTKPGQQTTVKQKKGNTRNPDVHFQSTRQTCRREQAKQRQPAINQ
jgi:hypothetical protein